MTSQAGILSPVPAHATFLRLVRRPDVSPADALRPWLQEPHPEHRIVGLGASLLAGLGRDGPPPIPADTGMPSTPGDLWVRVHGDDPGEVLHRVRALPLGAWIVDDRTDAFRFGPSLDLSGYEDGTENPTGADAEQAALASDGSSVLAVQRWVHDLDAFAAMGRARQDATFGRDRDSNDELDDAPPSAHVKRTAQEGFSPEAFVVRRSMPWRDARGAGLVFLAFGRSLDAFAAQCRRMAGLDDGIRDALFDWTRPVDGATYWCPPLREGRLHV